jgi:hypothetical protein
MNNFITAFRDTIHIGTIRRFSHWDAKEICKGVKPGTDYKIELDNGDVITGNTGWGEIYNWKKAIMEYQGS